MTAAKIVKLVITARQGKNITSWPNNVLVGKIRFNIVESHDSKNKSFKSRADLTF